jgi:hypothetical protein
MRNPTPQQIADARLAVEALEKHGGNVSHAAKALGIPRGTLQTRLSIAARLDSRDEKSEIVEAHALARKYEAEARDWKRRAEKAEQDRLEDKEVEAKIFGLSRAKIEPPKWLIEVKRGKSGAGVPCTVWSDWHFGEIVKPAEINGLNEYNLDIAETRFRRCIARTVDLAKNHMTGADYPGIVVNINGDMVSGEIHDEHKETNEDTTYGIILWTAERLVWGLLQLADQFGFVYVVGGFGNHGRDGKKIRFKTRAKRNADWLINQIVYSRLKNDKRFSWNIPLSGDAYYRVYGHRYFTTHGDALGVKGGDGIIGAIGPIMRGEIKTANSESSVGRNYDTLIIGHYHQPLWLPRAIVNNCGKGYDDYARFQLRAPFSLPSQMLWFTHPKWGITARWEVMLEGGQPAKESKPAPWVSAFPEKEAA